MKQELPSVDLSSGKRRYLFWSNTKMALGRKIRSHRSENGKKIMGEDPQSLENKGFSQISQLVLHSIKTTGFVRSWWFFFAFQLEKFCVSLRRGLQGDYGG